MQNTLSPKKLVSKRYYPAGEVAPIPFSTTMYNALDRFRLPVDKHGRPITGYGRDNLTTGQRMFPLRVKLADLYELTVGVRYDGVIERSENVKAYAEEIDGVMWVVRKSITPAPIIYHAQDKRDALAYLGRMGGRLAMREEGGRVVDYPIYEEIPVTAEIMANLDRIEKLRHEMQELANRYGRDEGNPRVVAAIAALTELNEEREQYLLTVK